MIDDIKNEVEELREKELKNQEEINKLKEILRLKDEKLESINAEMEMLKKEKLEMESRLKTFVENAKLKSEQVTEMQSIKTEKVKLDKIESIKSELNEKSEILQGNFDKKSDEIESINKEIKSLNDKIQLEMKEECKQASDESLMEIGIIEKINQLERSAENKLKGIFEMLIENFDEVRNKYRYICSEYFYARYRPYKLRLQINLFRDELRINLCICDDVMNHNLPFPFTADVTMRIINKNNRKVSKSIEIKDCQMNKPDDNSFNGSNPFEYSISELTKSGILESNCFIVECFVALK